MRAEDLWNSVLTAAQVAHPPLARWMTKRQDKLMPLFEGAAKQIARARLTVHRGSDAPPALTKEAAFQADLVKRVLDAGIQLDKVYLRPSYMDMSDYQNPPMYIKLSVIDGKLAYFYMGEHRELPPKGPYFFDDSVQSKETFVDDIRGLRGKEPLGNDFPPIKPPKPAPSGVVFKINTVVRFKDGGRKLWIVVRNTHGSMGLQALSGGDRGSSADPVRAEELDATYEPPKWEGKEAHKRYQAYVMNMMAYGNKDLIISAKGEHKDVDLEEALEATEAEDWALKADMLDESDTGLRDMVSSAQSRAERFAKRSAAAQSHPAKGQWHIAAQKAGLVARAAQNTLNSRAQGLSDMRASMLQTAKRDWKDTGPSVGEVTRLEGRFHDLYKLATTGADLLEQDKSPKVDLDKTLAEMRTIEQRLAGARTSYSIKPALETAERTVRLAKIQNDQRKAAKTAVRKSKGGKGLTFGDLAPFVAKDRYGMNIAVYRGGTLPQFSSYGYVQATDGHRLHVVSVPEATIGVMGIDPNGPAANEPVNAASVNQFGQDSAEARSAPDIKNIVSTIPSQNTFLVSRELAQRIIALARGIGGKGSEAVLFKDKVAVKRIIKDGVEYVALPGLEWENDHGRWNTEMPSFNLHYLAQALEIVGRFTQTAIVLKQDHVLSPAYMPIVVDGAVTQFHIIMPVRQDAPEVILTKAEAGKSFHIPAGFEVQFSKPEMYKGRRQVIASVQPSLNEAPYTVVLEEDERADESYVWNVGLGDRDPAFGTTRSRTNLTTVNTLREAKRAARIALYGLVVGGDEWKALL